MSDPPAKILRKSKRASERAQRILCEIPYPPACPENLRLQPTLSHPHSHLAFLRSPGNAIRLSLRGTILILPSAVLLLNDTLRRLLAILVFPNTELERAVTVPIKTIDFRIKREPYVSAAANFLACVASLRDCTLERILQHTTAFSEGSEVPFLTLHRRGGNVFGAAVVTEFLDFLDSIAALIVLRLGESGGAECEEGEGKEEQSAQSALDAEELHYEYGCGSGGSKWQVMDFAFAGCRWLWWEGMKSLSDDADECFLGEMVDLFIFE